MITGKISPCHDSGWASPIRLVGKKDGGLRITVDYYVLNKHTEAIAYPLPRIDVIFVYLADAYFFSILDLRSAFYQIELDKDSRKCTAFICHRGSFQWNVMPQGATNATETLQRCVDKIFKYLSHNILDAYVDDIIIYSKTLEEHEKDVKNVVDIMIENILKIRLDKCRIPETKIEYLSHVMEHGIIHPNPKKVRDLLKYQPPLTHKQTHALIGKATYYKKFIEHFAEIAAPLYAFLKIGSKTKWNNSMTNAVKTLQNKLTSDPILILSKFEEPFRVETDASGYGIGGVLSQQSLINQKLEWLQCAYFSEKLNNGERNYSATEKELFAIVKSVEYFRQFLFGINFKEITDH